MGLLLMSTGNGVHRPSALLLATLVCAACGPRHSVSEESPPLTPARAAAVEAGVRAFTQRVAQDVSQEGPAAWRKHFAEGPAFFMAADGVLVYPSGAAATQGIQELTHTLKHIELRWGHDLRVDPLTANLAVVASSFEEVMVNAAGQTVNDRGFLTGIVESQGGRWQFRDAHWSSLVPPPRAP